MAQALARAETAALILDPEWSKRLLREAHELTLPTDEELAARDKPSGTSAPLLNPEQEVRPRALQIAAREPALAKELAALRAKRLAQRQTQPSYSALAGQAIERGDITGAGHILSHQSRLIRPRWIISRITFC